MTVARKAVKEIIQGRAKDASVQLQGLQTQGTELAEQAEDQAKRLEKVQEYIQNKEEETQRKIREYGRKEQHLMSQRNSHQANLDSQRRILKDKRSCLVQARNTLSNAEKKRREKEILASIKASGFIGKLHHEAKIREINELKQDEERARREVDRCRSECSSAESAITESQQQISSIQSQLNSLSSQLTQMKQQRLKYNEEAVTYREAIVFLQDTVHFWLLFKHLSDHGVNRASLLQKIVDKAESKTDLSLLQRDASKRVATTFLDAWEELKTMIEDEGDQHSFQMEFKCSKCNGNYTELPYVKQTEVICKRCYHQHALT